MAQFSKGKHRYTVVEAQNIALGQLGFKTHTQGSSALTGEYVGVYNPNDVTVAVVATKSDHLNNADSYTGNLVSGGVIYGDFKAIECTTSGKTVIAYLG
jgi:hypothetical protein